MCSFYVASHLVPSLRRSTSNGRREKKVRTDTTENIFFGFNVSRILTKAFYVYPLYTLTNVTELFGSFGVVQSFFSLEHPCNRCGGGESGGWLRGLLPPAFAESSPSILAVTIMQLYSVLSKYSQRRCDLCDGMPWILDYQKASAIVRYNQKSFAIAVSFLFLRVRLRIFAERLQLVLTLNFFHQKNVFGRLKIDAKKCPSKSVESQPLDDIRRHCLPFVCFTAGKFCVGHLKSLSTRLSSHFTRHGNN